MAFTQGKLTLHIPPELLAVFEPKLPSFVKKENPLVDYPEDDVDEIAWGTFGTVYQVKKPDGTSKAVKALNAAPCEKDKFNKALKEAEIGLTIKHPNILPIEEVWYDGSRFFFVMDMIKPLTKENLPQSLKDHLVLFQQLVSVVEHLHSIGILHRDIKVQNCGIKVDEDGTQRLVLFDFGEACEVSESYPKCVGTVLHIAPEVLKAQYSDKSEIWALMSFLIEMLTGKSMILHFFLAEKASRIDVESKISKLLEPLSEPPIPAIFKTDKSRAGIRLLQILEKGLAINPAERLTFPELERLLQELIALL